VLCAQPIFQGQLFRFRDDRGAHSSDSHIYRPFVSLASPLKHRRKKLQTPPDSTFLLPYVFCVASAVRNIVLRDRVSGRPEALIALSRCCQRGEASTHGVASGRRRAKRLTHQISRPRQCGACGVLTPCGTTTERRSGSTRRVGCACMFQEPVGGVVTVRSLKRMYWYATSTARFLEMEASRWSLQRSASGSNGSTVRTGCGKSR
jgi:hypothetical protein